MFGADCCKKIKTKKLKLKFIKKENEERTIGNSILRLTLECIKYWSLMFNSSIFVKNYEELKAENVKFPSEIHYFKGFIKLF